MLEGRGLHFSRAIGGERSETQNQALQSLTKPNSVNLRKLKKSSNINAFNPSNTTTRLQMRRAKLYQLMLMMWRRGWDSNPRGLAPKTHLLNYLKTWDTYVAYWKAGCSKRFLAEHESDIALHKAAKAGFDSQGSKKLPTLKEIQVEYEKLLQQKRSIYPQFTHARQEMKAILTAKANVDRLLGYEEKSTRKARDHR